MQSLAFVSALLVAISQFGVILGDDQYYTAAVVDYQPTFDDELTGYENVMQNTRNYVQLIASVKGPLDIIVFPEMTLTFGCWATGDSTCATPVPKPEDVVAPCDHRFSQYYEDHLVELSCAARKNHIYLSVSMMEIISCLGEPDCSRNGFNIYSTNVVLDRNGTVISRYRKYNLIIEPFNVTTEAEVVTFDTDFGVTFGVFMCHDILFDKPARKLLDMSVKHFVLPIIWKNELPMFTSIQAQQRWSYENDVVLLAASANHPSFGLGGSGIYQGKHGPLATHFGNTNKSTIVVHQVQKSWGSLPSILPTPTTNTGLEDYDFRLSDFKEASMVPLDLNKPTRKLCATGNFCCTFNITAGDTLVRHNYHLVAYNQPRSIGMWRKAGIQICALLNCENDACDEKISITNLNAYPVTFKKIDISAEFSLNRTAQYPESLTSNYNPLPVDHFRWEMKNINNVSVWRSHSLVKPRSDIYMFGIVGREFGSDNNVGDFSCQIVQNGNIECQSKVQVVAASAISYTPLSTGILILSSLYCFIIV